MHAIEQNLLLQQGPARAVQGRTQTPNVDETRTPAALTQLCGAWQALAERANSPMQQHHWAQACAEAFGGKLRILSLGNQAQPTAIAPLCQRHGHLELLGVSELYEPADLLYADTAALDGLADALARLGQPLLLGRVPADSPTIAAIQRAFAGRGWVHVTPAAAFPALPLDANWQEPEQQFNAGRRSDFRRAQRNAEKLGAVSYEMLAPTPDELEPLLEEAYAVECAGWKGAAGTALARDTARGVFYRGLAFAAAEQGQLRLCFMRINEKAVAMQFAFECGQRFWLLKIGYDEQFARCSPGTLLMLFSVREAAARGLQSYEFLGAPEPWTSMWTKLERPCVALRVYPFNLSGARALAGTAVRLGWKKLRAAKGAAA